jgi:hypothetical protein
LRICLPRVRIAHRQVQPKIENIRSKVMEEIEEDLAKRGLVADPAALLEWYQKKLRDGI